MLLVIIVDVRVPHHHGLVVATRRDHESVIRRELDAGHVAAMTIVTTGTIDSGSPIAFMSAVSMATMGTIGSGSPIAIMSAVSMAMFTMLMRVSATNEPEESNH